MSSTKYAPQGPFDLLHQNQYFNGWPTLSSDEKTIVMAFPVEGWKSSGAVTLTQTSKRSLDIEVHNCNADSLASAQALAALSLDEDGSHWPDIGDDDEFVRGLQEKYQYMRPTLFHSPYEAAAAFIIGHRITIPQTRKIRAAISDEHGDHIDVSGETFSAFPLPQKLLKLRSFKGLSEVKISRLHAVAQAALDGLLDRKYLRGLDDEAALTKLETLPGVGPFFSQGILYRGVGIRDGLTKDDLTLHAIRTAYNLNESCSTEEVFKKAEDWHPYRMWVTVLMHVWLRETNNFPKRTFVKK